MAEATLFVRKATGLVRAWSIFDAFIYATFSINLITLGLYIFSFAPFIPSAHLVPAIIISGILIIFEVIIYAMLISIMPRAGGDYVWQSRILGGGWGYVLGMTGWVFILWHWVPLYGTMLVYLVLSPILAMLGSTANSPGLINAAVWLTGRDGLFIGSMVVIAFVFFYIAIGMKWYARIQKVCFYIGMVGLLSVFLVLLVASNSNFVAGFNNYVSSLFGATSANAYQEIIDAAAKDGYTPLPWGSMPIAASLALIPMVVFFNLWPNWGATLYGEIRGASDYKRNVLGMGGALVVTTILAIIFLALIAKTIGWEFYHAANYTFYAGTSPLPLFPYPGLLAAFITQNPVLQLWILLSLSLWFWGWSGTVFLSSSRVIFAAAFDRVLPEWMATVSPRFRTPTGALIVMTIPSIIVSLLYSYTPNFATFTLDATVVIAITYVGTTVAAILLPYRKRELFNASPVSRYTIGGIPAITISGVIFLLFLLYNIYMWSVDAVYGVNNPQSAIYMLLLYILAIVLYFGFKGYRRRQGIDINMVYQEIPVE